MRETGILIPLRMATLSDPFQPEEKIYGVALRVLRAATRVGVPIIVNTRMPAPSREHLRALAELAGMGLALVQISVTGLSEDWAWLRKYEPSSLPPSERMRAAGEYAEAGIPVIARLQPLIPGSVFWRDPRVGLSTIAGKVRGVVAEILRAEPGLYESILRSASINIELEEYAPGAKIVVPKRRVVRERFRALSLEASRLGLPFQTCKMGFPSLHVPSSMDCCYMRLLGRVARRPTLIDVYWEAVERGKLLVEDALRVACGRVGRLGYTPLCGDTLEALPSRVKRTLRVYERALERILLRSDLLASVIPDLRVYSGYVVPAEKPLEPR